MKCLEIKKDYNSEFNDKENEEVLSLIQKKYTSIKDLKDVYGSYEDFIEYFESYWTRYRVLKTVINENVFILEYAEYGYILFINDSPYYVVEVYEMASVDIINIIDRNIIVITATGHEDLKTVIVDLCNNDIHYTRSSTR